jgi:hypothetical protein
MNASADNAQKLGEDGELPFSELLAGVFDFVFFEEYILESESESELVAGVTL